jgi:hypothetical protein
MQSLYSCDESESVALTAMIDTIPSILSWIRLFYNNGPDARHGATVAMGQ